MDAPKDMKKYLYSSEPLLERLECVRLSISKPVDVPIGITDDEVLLWLTRLLTSKVFDLNAEETEASWITLRDVLSSSRIEALCQRGWTCLLSASFIETLVDHVLTTDSSVRSHAVSIVHILAKNPQLRSVLMHQLKDCLMLLGGMVKWLTDESKSDMDVSCAIMLVEQVCSYMERESDPRNNIVLVLDCLLLPLASLRASVANEHRENILELFSKLEDLLSSSLFSDNMHQVYHNILNALFSEETKVALPEEGKKIFSSLTSVIANESIEISEHLLFIFVKRFLISYNQHTNMCHEMLMVLCFVICGSDEGFKKIFKNSNNLASQEIIAANCDPDKREALLLSLLGAVKEVHLSRNASHSCDPWLGKLGKVLIKHSLHSASGVQCLQMLLHLQSNTMAELIVKNFCIIVSKIRNHAKDKNNQMNVSESLGSALDDLLCDVLQVYYQLREVPKLLVGILHSFLEEPINLTECPVLPKSLHTYERNLVFPSRFIFEAMKVIRMFDHTNIIATWKVFLSLLTKDFARFLQEGSNTTKLKLVSATVWLFSCILSSFPIVEKISFPGVSSSIAELMTQTAKDVIQPFIASMLTLTHNNDVCGSILVLCHTWGELHTNLCTYDVYVEESGVTKVILPEPSQQPTDFSYVLPSITSEQWAQISARVVNFGNQTAQVAVAQLVLQKLSYTVLHHQNNYDVECKGETVSPTGQVIESSTKYLLNAIDTWGEGVMELLVMHLSYLIPFIQEEQLSLFARHLVTGFKEGKQHWLMYIESEHFLEVSRLHSHILLIICSTLASGCSSRKRKLSDCEAELPVQKNYWKKLYNKLANKEVILSCSSSAKTKETIASFHKDTGTAFNKLLESKNKPHEPFGCVRDIDIFRKLIKRIPYTFSDELRKDVILFMLLSSLVNDEFSSKQEKFEFLQDTTALLTKEDSIHILSLIDKNLFVKYLIKKRISLPLAIYSSRVIPSVGTSTSSPCLKQVEKTKDFQKSDTLISNEFDLLIRLILESAELWDQPSFMQDLAEYVTRSEELEADEHTRLHIAVLLLWVCHRKLLIQNQGDKERTKVCEEVFNTLSVWVLHYLKKADMTTIQPSTAASLLTAHAVIIFKNATNVKGAGRLSAGENLVEVIATENMRTPQKDKVPKYLKHLKCSLKLSELCLSGRNADLLGICCQFYGTIGKCFATVESHLPPEFFTTTWVALSDPDLWSKNKGSKQELEQCLISLIPIASIDAFTELIKVLLNDTQLEENIFHSLSLWQLVLPTRMNEDKANLKRMAVDHFVPLLVNLVTSSDPDVFPKTLLPRVVETLHVAVKSKLMLSNQARGLLLKFCTVVPLLTLERDDFYKTFIGSMEMMCFLTMHSNDFMVERIPSLLAVIGHFSEALIIRSNQDQNLESEEVQHLVKCSMILERLVGSLRAHREALTKVVHFTIARIIMALQHTAVYPEVKVNLETLTYHLLDITDDFSYNHLLLSLPQGRTALLQRMYTNFKKFYKYHSNSRKGLNS